MGILLGGLSLLISLTALWLVTEVRSTAKEQLTNGTKALIKPAFDELAQMRKNQKLMAKVLKRMKHRIDDSKMADSVPRQDDPDLDDDDAGAAPQRSTA